MVVVLNVFTKEMRPKVTEWRLVTHTWLVYVAPKSS